MKNRKLVALVLAAVVVLAFFLISETRIKTEMAAAQVFFAKQDIPAHTQITEEMITAIELPKKGLPPGIIYDKNQIVGKWTQSSYGIPQNGFFYTEKVVTAKQLLDATRMKLKPNQVLWTGDVNLHASAAGNITDDQYVDVWYQAVQPTENGDTQWVSGRLYENVLVLSTKNKKGEELVEKNTTNQVDANGKPVQVNKELIPSVVQLAVTDEQFQLLTASLTSAFNSGKIILVPRADGSSTNPEMVSTGIMDVKPFIVSKMFDMGTLGNVKAPTESTNNEINGSKNTVSITGNQNLSEILNNIDKGDE